MKRFLILVFLFSTHSLRSQDEHEEVFTEVYDSSIWGQNEEGEGFSGGGSLLQNTILYIDFVQQFMKLHEIKTVVDAGCGDWEFSKYMDWSNVQYSGYDVVKHVIEKNQEKFSRPNIQFIHGNFLRIDLPSADLLLCKHVLQHISNHDIELFLAQCTKYKYCLITNQIDPKTLSGDNEDIPTGHCHKVDLSKPPFNCAGTKVLTYVIDENSVHQVFLIDNTL